MGKISTVAFWIIYNYIQSITLLNIEPQAAVQPQYNQGDNFITDNLFVGEHNLFVRGIQLYVL